MPSTRIIRFGTRDGAQIEVARLSSLGEALDFARASGDRAAWLVLETEPPVWLSATSLMGETNASGAVNRFYRLARERLAAEGVSATDIETQLPLLPGGAVPDGV